MIISDKVFKNITQKTYQKLSEDKKIEVLMNMKNRAKLRHVLAVYITVQPFENFALSKNNLLELGQKLFSVNSNDTLIKED